MRMISIFNTCLSFLYFGPVFDVRGSINGSYFWVINKSFQACQDLRENLERSGTGHLLFMLKMLRTNGSSGARFSLELKSYLFMPSSFSSTLVSGMGVYIGAAVVSV